jgi:hypothetical protein
LVVPASEAQAATHLSVAVVPTKSAGSAFQPKSRGLWVRTGACHRAAKPDPLIGATKDREQASTKKRQRYAPPPVSWPDAMMHAAALRRRDAMLPRGRRVSAR